MNDDLVGRGQLRHFFHGEYSAALVIVFGAPEHATRVLGVLGAPWKRHENELRVVVAVAGGPVLESVLKRLESFGADRKKITSLRRSVDYGEPFEVRIPEGEVAS